MDVEGNPGLRSHVTLALCTLLHAFTHAYGALLVPLYLLMQRDLKLPGVGYASLIATTYGLVYCLASYPAGVMADRFNRKALLGIGLLGNAVAVAAMGLTRSYHLLIVWAILAGLFGTLFHPTANALVPAHYPRSPGMAIGIMGMGSGLGFFLGPQFAGWRAQGAQWTLLDVADWQRPLVEAGIAGFVIGVVFLFVAREVRERHRLAYSGTTREPPSTNGDGQAETPAGEAEPMRRTCSRRSARPAGKVLGLRVALLGCVLGCRDFAGVAALSLCSIYLQKAQGFDPRQVGFTLGMMMVLSTFVNPLAVWLSPGRRRLPLLAGVLIAAGMIVCTVPLWSVATVLIALCGFQTLQLTSYAVSDAAMLERVESHVRGRVVGIFLTVAGTFSAMAPVLMGFWTDRLGERASQSLSYLPLFGSLGALMAVSAASMPLIASLGRPISGAIEPFTETTPATLEPAG